MSEPRSVSDLMTRDLITLREEDDLWEVQDEMGNLGLRHIPVVDGTKFVGLLSHKQLLRFSVSQLSRGSIHQNLDAVRKQGTFVAGVMERDVPTAPPDMPLHEAAKLLADQKLGCLPVVESDGTLVGLVTESDFMTLLARLLAERVASMG